MRSDAPLHCVPEMERNQFELPVMKASLIPPVAKRLLAPTSDGRTPPELTEGWEKEEVGGF